MHCAVTGKQGPLDPSNPGGCRRRQVPLSRWTCESSSAGGAWAPEPLPRTDTPRRTAGRNLARSSRRPQKSLPQKSMMSSLPCHHVSHSTPSLRFFYKTSEVMHFNKVIECDIREGHTGGSFDSAAHRFCTAQYFCHVPSSKEYKELSSSSKSTSLCTASCSSSILTAVLQYS